MLSLAKKSSIIKAVVLKDNTTPTENKTGWI